MNALADIYFRPVLSIFHEKKYVCLRFAALFASRAIFKSFDSKMKENVFDEHLFRVESVLKSLRIKKNCVYLLSKWAYIYICVYVYRNELNCESH